MKFEKLETEFSRANQGYVIGMTTMRDALALINCSNPSPGALRQATVILQAGIESAKKARQGVEL
jgi:hypothetical protein